jgi:oxygen-independent coproporphyrinogen-3 oxidase
MRDFPHDASVYVHVPFCTVLCPFCDFYKRRADADSERLFCDALVAEIANYRGKTRIKVPTLFFGGGTPSVLSEQSFLQIFKALHDSFDLSDLKELSIEVNPEDVTHEFCQFLKKLAVTRVSLGVQSFFDDDCSFLGRAHTAKQAHEALAILGGYEFNLSIDLIFGMPTLTKQRLNQNLDIAFSYPIHHLSTYCLTIEPHTVFHKKGIKTCGSEQEREQYELIQKRCSKKGFLQYEVSSFALPGYRCEHNMRYWQYNDYIGLGPSAHSLLVPYRFQNKAAFKGYIANPTPDYFDSNLQPYSVDTLLEEHILAAFRLRDGIYVPEFNRRYSIDFFNRYATAIQVCKDRAWLRQDGDRLISTQEGLMFLDELMIEFLG